MPRGDKSSYSNKQKRQAEHIEKGYEGRGASAKESAICCWETGTGMKSAPTSFAISRAALASLYISSPKAMVKARIGRLKWHCAKPSTAQESIPPLK